jgi:hypothetical protein
LVVLSTFLTDASILTFVRNARKGDGGRRDAAKERAVHCAGAYLNAHASLEETDGGDH